MSLCQTFLFSYMVSRVAGSAFPRHILEILFPDKILAAYNRILRAHPPSALFILITATTAPALYVVRNTKGREGREGEGREGLPKVSCISNMNQKYHILLQKLLNRLCSVVSNASLFGC